MIEDSRGQLVRLSGLWKRTSKNGEAYYSGGLRTVRVLVIRNEKRTEQDADLTLFLAAAP